MLPLSLIASAILPLVAQVGPFTAPGTMGTPLPEKIERPARTRRLAQPALPSVPQGSTRLHECLTAVAADPVNGGVTAETWLASATGRDGAEAGLCLGMALSGQENWSGAEQAFLNAAAAAGSDRLLRTRLGAMAGNAALAGGDPQRALAALDTARSEAAGLADPAWIAPIALDRARALVALNRPTEAAEALAEARTAAPADAEAWLLSATLSRRQGQLATAQTQIERAAELRPIDPDIGIEAGVIAMLAGRPAAARKSWQSVADMAPGSTAAATALGYLAQLDPAPAHLAPAATKPDHPAATSR